MNAAEEAKLLAISKVAAASAAALAGGDANTAANIAETAVRNNYLTTYKMKEIESCLKGITCKTQQEQNTALRNAETLSKALDKEVHNLCTTNPLGDACRNSVNSMMQYLALDSAWVYMKKDAIRVSKNIFNYLYNTSGANNRFVKYFNTIDNRANFFAASNLYEKHIGSKVKWF
ncbi:VENN motif pre-toxin domain-containing protein [Uruburuella testudinis]|uniref:VENN motif pre-toxin domain-containing protein n=1 Tax=Uruburuella testudinis TaxID=1282863 RepID=A0ABY4DR03_9NEIS|nr:VENN motif pre-toxin domain-containing protein [Uruburuella testudinis]UOO81482.1 VENN motif pre-toxin domain-containing protein [Uruburuella testudinis]